MIRVEWTQEDELDYQENMARLRATEEKDSMKTWFDRAIEWTLIGIGIGSVVEACRILMEIHRIS